MRLYGAIQKVEPQDDGTVRVYGIATSEAVDEQGEIVRADAIRAAIPDYMRFPALREMHQLSAAGTTLEAEVYEDGTTRILAHVVDPVAVAKVKNQVYRGFSIGGRVTQREAGNPRTITGLVLNEISLVDRPANPEAIFGCWKAVVAPDAPLGLAEPPVAKGGPASSIEVPLAQEPFNPPIQIWTCCVPDHRHLAKADALKCLKDGAGPAEDMQGSAAARATMANGERAVSGAESHKNSLEASKTDHDVRHAHAGYQPDGRKRYSIEEIGERVGEAETNSLPFASEMPEMLGTAVGAPDLERGAAFLQAGGPHMRQFAADIIAKAKHSQADQAMLDMAHFACDQCLKIGRLPIDEQANMDLARRHLQEAGAAATALWTAERPGDNNPSPASPESPMGDSAEADVVKVLSIGTDVVCKREQAHQHLMDLAHECLKALTDGCVCEQTAKFGARHSEETMEHFKTSHRHLAAAGARCDAAGVDGPTAKLASGRDACVSDLPNALPGVLAEKAALAKVLDEVVPMLERLTKRVDEIARTPLPPLTMAKGTVSVSKQQDRGSNLGSGGPELPPEAIAAALAKMSKEEQTLTLIKASYATPIRIPGAAADDR